MALRRIFAQSFLIQIFPHLFKKNQKISEWIILLHSLKENSSWNLLCHQNTPENATDFQSWDLINKLHDWSSDATDHNGHSLKWCTKQEKLFVLIYFFLLHKIGSCLTLHFVLLCKLTHMKTKGSVCNAHLDLRGKICEKKVRIIHSKYSSLKIN